MNNYIFDSGYKKLFNSFGLDIDMVLKKARLSEFDVDDSISARVRRVLSELLPEGISNIEEVSQKLGISKRTL